jgi:hypothetical protein
MRKRIGIGVAAAALLFGLVAPSVNGAARSDQVVTAGVGAGAGEAFTAFGRALRALLPFLEHDGPALEAAIREFERIVPMVVHTRWGEVKLSERQWWKLVDVACKAKDVNDFRREDEVDRRLWMLAAELPEPIGSAASVVNLANEMAQAKYSDDRERALATARVCGRAAKLAHG